LAADDLTIANLEMTLTRSTTPEPGKIFYFGGKPEHARVLVEGSVELVNVANNHSVDFGPAGLRDTLDALRAVGVSATGDALVDRRMIKGVEVVNLGFMGGLDKKRARVV